MCSEQTDQLQDVQCRVKLAEGLFTEHGEFIRAVIRYTIGDDEHTDEFFNQLFLFFVARPIPEDIRSVRGFIYRVILGKIRDWQRSSALYRKKLWRYGQLKQQEFAELPQELFPGERLEQTREMLDIIEKCLSKTEAKAILLRYGEHYPLEKVAEEMNIKPRSVSRYISIGLKKIRGLLSAEERSDYDEGA